MNSIRVSDQFDGGNIEVISTDNANNIELAIRKDNASDFLQWFSFRVEGEIGETYRFNIINAGKSSYSKGWKDYSVCTSWDRDKWFRTPCHYAGGVLSFELQLDQSTVHFAYFAPYSHERHLDLLAWAQHDPRVTAETLGQTIDGRAISLLRASETDEPKHKIWVIARQHPGETMAEWFIEGFLETLLDKADPLANKLLQTTAFYVVPNMNPDGSSRGNLRTNAAGANLNREWESPSIDKSPEVYWVQERMKKEGGDLFLDIHGDEELPYNFVAGCEGNKSYDQRHAELETTFKDAFMSISPDFQDTHGYPKDEPGKADMRLAANWLGEHFKTLSFTIEMPFKDNADLPNLETGWSPERSAQLGHDVLYPISAVLKKLMQD